MASYYIIRGGEQSGPIDEKNIRQRLSEGTLGFYDLCWKEGMTDWRAIRDVVDLGDMKMPPKPPQASPPPLPPNRSRTGR